MQTQTFQYPSNLAVPVLVPKSGFGKILFVKGLHNVCLKGDNRKDE